MGGEIGEEFWTEKGLRQECLLSPMLFNVLMADEKEVSKRVKGESKIKRIESIHFSLC